MAAPNGLNCACAAVEAIVSANAQAIVFFKAALRSSLDNCGDKAAGNPRLDYVSASRTARAIDCFNQAPNLAPFAGEGAFGAA